MKKLEWYYLEDKDRKLDRKLQRKVRSLYRLCQKHGLSYAEVYVLSTEESTTLNIRAKNGKDVVANSYAFAR